LAQEPVILSVAKQNGWQTIGVEPSDKAKVIAISFVEDTAELQNQSFDVISMWHVWNMSLIWTIR
jgi:hypothetical protein